jgi:hypothetical protein
MKTTEELWRAVQGALDAGRDPFESGELHAALEAAPRVSSEVERLQRRLALLRAQPRELAGVELSKRRAVHGTRAYFAAAVAASALLLFIWSTRAPRADAVAESPTTPASEVLACSIVVEHRRPGTPTLKRVNRSATGVVVWTLSGVER